ncbi:MAG: ribonuclease III [Clostridia bacterium]|nr:ribonuclease III [Clostridia bacterium]
MIFEIAEVEEKIGYSFTDKMLLRKCFTHSSYAYENNTDDNEKLEFFGDAILQFVITEYLYKNYSGDEGVLTKLRASLVSKVPLLKIINGLGLGDYMLFGCGQENSDNKTEKLYSSLYEAICAGIYIDGGVKETKKFIERTLIKAFNKGEIGESTEKISAEFKTYLQEYVQKRKIGSISYEVLSKKGPDNLPEFRVATLLNGKKIAEGTGRSKKEAEAVGAEKALNNLIKQGGK